MLNVGFVGVWHVHTDDYFRQLVSSGKANIVAVWDEDAETGKAWAEKHGVAFIADYDALLARKDIQAIICDAPTTQHLPLLEKAAAAGKHIFTEKLLATNTADGERLCKAIEGAGIVCTVSLPLLTTGRVQYIKKLIDDGRLGRVTGARMRRSHSGVSDKWLPPRWFDVNKSGGGAMMDLGAHPVYVLAHLLGKPVRVSGMMTNMFGTSSDENAIALVEFENGVLGTCETGFATFGVPDLLEVYGTEGSVFMRGTEMQVATKDMRQVGVSSAEPTALPENLPMPVVQFVDACLEGKPSPANLTVADALTMTRIIEAAYASDKDGATKAL